MLTTIALVLGAVILCQLTGQGLGHAIFNIFWNSSSMCEARFKMMAYLPLVLIGIFLMYLLLQVVQDAPHKKVFIGDVSSTPSVSTKQKSASKHSVHRKSASHARHKPAS